jgi:hypothetical protein
MLTSAPFTSVKPQRVQNRARRRRGFPRSLLRNLRAHPELLRYRLREFDSAIAGLLHGFSNCTSSWMTGHGMLRDGLHAVVVNEASSAEAWPCRFTLSLPKTSSALNWWQLADLGRQTDRES